MALHYLKTNSLAHIICGPITSYSNALTPITAMSVEAATCEMMREHNAGSVVTRVAMTLTASGGENDFVHVTNDVAGGWDLEIQASQINWLGDARIQFSDPDKFVGFWEDIRVVSTNLFNALRTAGSLLDVDATLVNHATPVTAAAISDAVHEEPMSQHIAAGSFGKYVGDLLEDTGTTLDNMLSTVNGNVSAILTDTGTTLDDMLSTVAGNVTAILEDTGTTLDNVLSTVAGQVAGIIDDTGTAGVLLSATAISNIYAKVLAGSMTAIQLGRIMAAWFAGVTSGGGTATISIFDPDGTKAVVTLGMVDANGNRGTVTLDKDA